MPLFKVTAQGDNVYFDAPDMNKAKLQFERDFGKVPEAMLQWSSIKKLPKGEIAIKIK